MSTLNTYLSFRDFDTNYAFQDAVEHTLTGDHSDRIYFNCTNTPNITTYTFHTDIGDAGYVYLRNFHATAEVGVSFTSPAAGALTACELLLLPKQAMLFPLEPTTADLYLVADGSSPQVEIWVREA